MKNSIFYDEDDIKRDIDLEADYVSSEYAVYDHHKTPKSGIDVINRFICAAYARNADSAVAYEVQSITPYWINTYEREEI